MEEYNLKGRWKRAKETWELRHDWTGFNKLEHLGRCWESFWDTPSHRIQKEVN